MSVKCINKNTIRDMSKETFINLIFSIVNVTFWKMIHLLVTQLHFAV